MKAIYISIGAFLMWSLVLLLAPSTPFFIGWTIIVAAVAATVFLGVGRLMFNSPPEWDTDQPQMPPGRYMRVPIIGDSDGNVDLAPNAAPAWAIKRGKVIYPSYWRRVKAWLQGKPPPPPKVEPPTVTFKTPPATGHTALICQTDYTIPAVSDNDTQKMLTVYSLKTGGTIFYTTDPWSLTDKLCSVHVENMNPRQRLIVEISCALMNEKDYQEVSRDAY